eukprot:s37_g55.t1
MRPASAATRFQEEQGAKGSHVGFAMSADLAIEKPLATWKTWWPKELPCAIGRSLFEHIDFTKLPGQGKLLTKESFRQGDLKDAYTAGIVEGMVVAYPHDKQPSAYLLGDSVIQLDKLMKHSLLGVPSSNPIRERSRRDSALAEGGKLRKLLSFVRTSSLKHPVGRSDEATYLKSIANHRIVRSKSSSSSTASSVSQDSPAPASGPAFSPEQVSPAMQATQDLDIDVIDRTLLLLGLDPNQGHSQLHVEWAAQKYLGTKPDVEFPLQSTTVDSEPSPVSEKVKLEDAVVNPRDQLRLADSRKRPNGQVDPSAMPEQEAAVAKKPRVESDGAPDAAVSEPHAPSAGGPPGQLPIPVGMPTEALPQGPRKGRLSYTVTSSHTGAKVEVHLKGKAFRIIKVGSCDGKPLKEKLPASVQKPWFENISDAWKEATMESGWYLPATDGC